MPRRHLAYVHHLDVFPLMVNWAERCSLYPIIGRIHCGIEFGRDMQTDQSHLKCSRASSLVLSVVGTLDELISRLKYRVALEKP